MKTGSNLFVHCKWLYFLAASALMLGIPLKSGGVPPPPKIVAKNGSDSNLGTADSPWLTLTHALSQVVAGDTVQLREGKYCESDKYITGLNGNSSAWITIESYPGERAWITGSLSSTFESGGGWKESDISGIGLYQSIDSFTTTNKLGGWLLDSNGKLTDSSPQLLQYVDPTLAKSTNYVTPNCYVGPGVYAENGKIHIRLQQNTNDTKDRNGNNINPIPSDTNPNKNKILIFTNERIFTFYGSSYIRLRNLDLGPGYCVLRMSNNSHHIEVDGCNIYLKNIGVAADSGCANIEVKNCKLNMGFPEWIYWDDVKNTFKPADASGWNSFACYGVWNNSSVHDNTFINCFDGILIYAGSVNSQIYNNKFIRGRDDAIDLCADVSNIEIRDNIIRHCNEGFSIIANHGGTVGDVYIHNNVTDMTGYHREARPVSAGANATWSSGIPWGRHGDPESVCYGTQWKIYNNTIVARDCNGHTTLPKSYPNYNNTFYNNITLLLSNLCIYTETLEDSAGNVFWRTTGGLVNFEEPQGLEADPGFNLSKITSESSYDTGTMWNLYKPSNMLVSTIGVNYSGLGWPNTSGLNYRGAIAGDNGLTGQWKFDNNATDASGLNNNGIVYGGASYSTDRKTGANAIILDGGNDYVEIANSESLNVTKQFTVSAWIKPDSVSALQGIVTKLTDDSARQYALSISASGYLVFDYEAAGNNYQLVSSSALTAGVWQHVAATVDDALNVRLYVNGVQVAGGIAPSESVATTEPVTIGRWGGSYDTNHFCGLIDDVRIYRRNLSGDEVFGLARLLGGFWKMNDGSGAAAADGSGNANSGTLYGSAWSAGIDEGALSLNGSGDYVEIPSSESLNITKDLTISAWIKPNSVSRLQGIITKLTSPSAKQYALSISSTGKLEFDYEYTGNNYQLLTSASLVTNKWQHVAATVDASSPLNVTLYINGVQAASGTINLEPVATTEPVAIGRWGGSYDTNFFEGAIDDARIHAAALTGAEIQQLVWQDQKLVGYWKLDEDSGSVAEDAAGLLAATASSTAFDMPLKSNGTVNSATWISGGLSFDKTNDYVQIPSSSEINKTCNFTIAAKIKTGSNVTSFQSIAAKVYNGSAKQYSLSINASELQFDYEGGGGNDYSVSGGTIPANTWLHVAVTVDASLLVTLYVNGASVKSDTAPAQTVPNSYPLMLGCWYGASYNYTNCFGGIMDEVKFYGRALSAAEITDLYNGN